MVTCFQQNFHYFWCFYDYSGLSNTKQDLQWSLARKKYNCKITFIIRVYHVPLGSLAPLTLKHKNNKDDLNQCKIWCKANISEHLIRSQTFKGSKSEFSTMFGVLIAVPGLALTAGAFILPVGTPSPALAAPDSRRRRRREGAGGRGGGGEGPAWRQEEDCRLLVLRQGRRGVAGWRIHCWLWAWEKRQREEKQVKPIRALFIPQGAIMQAAVQINLGMCTNELNNLKNLQWRQRKE